MSTLLLVDGNALLHRGYHALPNLTNHEGVPTGGAFGFTRLLLSAMRILQPDYVAVTFDSRGPTFRHHAFAAYKANRVKGPDDLYAQMPLVQEIVKSLSIPMYVVPGFEADDLIGTLSKAATKKKVETRIVTGDMDLVQLVDDHVFLFAPTKGVSETTIYTPQSVVAKYTFAPDKMVFFKALAGDSSDNIPGIPGIGQVSAKKIVNQFDGLDDLYTHLQRGGSITGLSPRLIEKIRDGKESAYTSFTLATIDCQVPITLKLNECKTHDFDREKVMDTLIKLDFRSLIKELPGASVEVVTPAETEDSGKNGALSELDKKLQPVLRSMEKTGVKIDVPYVAKLEKEWKSELASSEAKITKLAGRPFNIASPKQLGEILFDVLKLPTEGIKKNQSGYSTDAAQLELLAPLHKIVDEVITYRELAKLINTYTVPLQQSVDTDGRLHTTYDAATATGRLSSKNPNLQNIPIRTERGKKLRHAFIANKGCSLIAADYSQIELRVVAHLSKDPVMLAAFRRGDDIHAATSKEMGVDRRIAKVINFSILYGKGPHGFARDLGIDIKEAADYIDRYFATYRGINSWINETLNFVSKNGYAETLFGRRRYFPGLKGKKAHRYSRLAREAINMPVQGTAAEILKHAMIAIYADPALKDTMRLTVHDELVFEVKTAEVEKLLPKIKNHMENVTPLDAPVVVEIGSGTTWGSIKE